MTRVLLRCGLLCGALAVATAGHATTCGVQSTGVAFGSYDSLSPTALDGVGNVRVTCDLVASFTVSLGTGTGSYQQRKMVRGQSALLYNLYRDVTRTLGWDDTLPGAGVAATGLVVNLPVYGRIPARQSVAAGIYTDSVTVTVTY